LKARQKAEKKGKYAFLIVGRPFRKLIYLCDALFMICCADFMTFKGITRWFHISD